MTFMDSVTDRTLAKIACNWVHSHTQLLKKMAADQGHNVLQYYINIIANTQQLLDMEDLFGTSAN